METKLFWAAIVLAIVSLNWLRISLFGLLPPGNSPTTAWITTLVALAIDLGLFCKVYSLRRQRLVREGCPEDQLDIRGQMKFVAEQRQAASLAETERKQALALAQQAELDEARAGELSPIHPTRAITHKGEVAYGLIPAALCEVRTVAYKGRSSGVSLRVAKGVTVRTGGYKGSPQKEMITAATGELVVTNKRLIFAGDKKSLAINLALLIAVDRSASGFTLSESNKTHFLRVENSHRSRVFEAILARLVSEL